MRDILHSTTGLPLDQKKAVLLHHIRNFNTRVGGEKQCWSHLVASVFLMTYKLRLTTQKRGTNNREIVIGRVVNLFSRNIIGFFVYLF